MTRSAPAILLTFGAALQGACGTDFTPQSEVDRLRVLTVKVSVGEQDSAWPRVSETATLTALVTDVTPFDPRAADYRWTFCPVAFGSDADFGCIVTAEQFQALIIEVFPELPDGTPTDEVLDVDFDLGTNPEATFNFRDVLLEPNAPVTDEGLEALLAAACEFLQTVEFTDFVQRPTCNGTFEARLEVLVALEDSRPGDVPPTDVRAQRPLEIIYAQDVVVPNRNPSLDQVCIRSTTSTGAGVLFGEPCQIANPDFGWVILDPSDPNPLPLDQTLGLATDVVVLPGNFDIDAEFFRPLDDDLLPGPEEQERLTLSWFVESGEIDRNRTAFEQGSESSTAERAATNAWTTPRLIDVGDDVPGTLHIVMRDNRGGRAFTSRRVIFTSAGTN